MVPARDDRWTPVALSGDVPAATVVPAMIPEASIALWRSQSGRLVAVADRCPHRGMRLSHGFVRGEALSCIYHGWSYGLAGQCTRIPAHPGLAPPEAIRVETFDAAESGGVIWVRVANANAAGSTMPPTYSGFEGLRSIPVAASAAAIAAAVNAQADPDGLIRADLAGTKVGFLVGPQGNGSILHLLVATSTDLATRIRLSRALETVRRAAETLQAESEAA